MLGQRICRALVAAGATLAAVSVTAPAVQATTTATAFTVPCGNDGTPPCPQITDVAPRLLTAGDITDLRVTGAALNAVSEVRLLPAGVNLRFTVVDSSRLTARLPHDLGAGSYTVQITGRGATSQSDTIGVVAAGPEPTPARASAQVAAPPAATPVMSKPTSSLRGVAAAATSSSAHSSLGTSVSVIVAVGLLVGALVGAAYARRRWRRTKRRGLEQIDAALLRLWGMEAESKKGRDPRI
jgi:hypothetical protein